MISLTNEGFMWRRGLRDSGGHHAVDGLSVRHSNRRLQPRFRRNAQQL